MVSSASFAVVTVPEPSRSVGCSFFNSRRRSTAPGTVMVTSTTVTPPAIMASTTACAWRKFLARRTGINPTRSMVCAVDSDIFSFLRNVSARSASIPMPKSRPFDELRQVVGHLTSLARDARRSALHGAFHFRESGHAGVARRGHRQRPVRHAALHGPLDGLAGKESINEPGSEAVAAAHAIENIDLALRDMHDLVLVERDGSPRIAAGGLRGAQCAGDELQIRISRGHFAQHLFVAGNRQLTEVVADALDLYAQHGGEIFFVAEQQIDLAHQFAVHFLGLGFSADGSPQRIAIV